jgi:BirA family biotin operon repressor/biotin-[acetyl-CoA-carboxylase] ligase
MQNQIIHFLKKNGNYLSGEEISRQLKISRAAIWKNIQELRKEGYKITAVSHRGYKLTACPDKLIPREIQFGLNTKTFGKKIVYSPVVPSTMDLAFQLGVDGSPEGTVVLCETQTKGRGRMGRPWNSPKSKGIYMSIILRPALSPADVAQITLLSAVVVREAVQKVSQVDVTIKWPNDLLVQRKKVAGILTELSAEMDRVRFCVVGIGINVNTPLSALPSGATSLKKAAKRPLKRVEIVQEILRSLERWNDGLKAKGFRPVLDAWKKHSSTLGQRIRIADQNGSTQGVAVDLDERGAILIRNAKGDLVKKMTGDISFL